MSKKSGKKVVQSSEKKLRLAEQLLANRQWDEAAAVLKNHTQRNPSSIIGWDMLGAVYQAQKNKLGLWDVAHRLVALQPSNPVYSFNAALVCLANNLPFSALQHIEHYLNTWPEGDDAAELRDIKKSLDKQCAAIMADDSMTPEAQATELALFEQAQMYLSLGDYKKGREVARQAAEKLPDAAAPLNNLSLTYALEGQLDEAIGITRRVLERFPDNLHARCNLAQFLFRLGQLTEVEQMAADLREEAPSGVLAWMKLIETFAYLGDDLTVVALYERNEASTSLDNLPAMTNHLVAVSFARQGDLKKANRLWQKALKDDPGLELARQNVADLKKPVGERSGAWPFPLQQWLPSTWIQQLYRVALQGKRSDTAMKREIELLLKRLPGLAAVLPILLERGDPQGREFALHVVTQASLPILREYALDTHGTDQSRMQAAQEAVERGLLSRGKPIPLYIEGERRELLLLSYEIYTEPERSKLSKQAQDLLQQSHDALLRGDAETAMKFVHEGLALIPDNPTFLNHLAAAQGLLGRSDEANATVRRMAELHPNYLFARCAMAELCVREGRTEEARAWLEPLLDMPRLHISEFSALCAAQVSLLIQTGPIEGARSWLSLWEQVAPGHPEIRRLRRLIGKRAKSGI